MRIYLAESLPKVSKIEFLSLKHGLFQSPIEDNLLQIVEKINQCEAILVPHDAYHFHENRDYINYLNQLSSFKMIIYSDRGDFPKHTKISNSVAIRVAINPGERITNKVVIPYNIEPLDFLPIRRLTKGPRISFVGYLPHISPSRFKNTLQQSPLHPILGNGAVVRKMCLNRLKNSKFDATVIKRPSYGAHPGTNNSIDLSRSEYLGAFADSDFVLTPRGDSNQSARFYEALSSGRTPILPDTMIVLPKPISSNLPIRAFWALTSVFSVKQLEKSVEKRWNQFLTNESYVQYQSEMKYYFQNQLQFNNYIRTLFGLDLRQFSEMASRSAEDRTT